MFFFFLGGGRLVTVGVFVGQKTPPRVVGLLIHKMNIFFGRKSIAKIMCGNGMEKQS